ncbi:hypothetical protein DS901_01045 [Loktanella sp. D2R18]|uniref:hypothetical protein n=1 Tax=Rhodobacterales TaxID=204455 RepID=UPI000DE8E050|nr:MULTISPECIES: hypothetical protein [Rhodobacterales]MDO6590128.1 hypothetical protein [Yoonia sp. 1_MG-2023]RBW45756.1 hypothetical protein DS901_01045 [Loktanella sp. D2R18]
MGNDFENAVKAEFIEYRIGNRKDEIADVDLHFVLPLKVYAKYEALIAKITNGEFKVNAGYNLALLYTNPQDARRAGTVTFSKDIDWLIVNWSGLLDEIATDPDKSSQLDKFRGLHSFFRSALWLEENASDDPCAGANTLILKSARKKKPFWRRILN